MTFYQLPNHAALWDDFFSQRSLTKVQQDQFQAYYRLLVETNELHNLTTITDLKKVLADHFDDSLALEKFVNCSELSALADVGTGAGFPALPLKIAYPHLSLVLIEVNHKKIQFLKMVVEVLGLSDVIISDLDWRTFLRKTDYSIDLFCSRASLAPEELIRMFKPSCAYRNATLVYWASQHWEPVAAVIPCIERKEAYEVDTKMRQLIFLRGNPLQAT